MNKRFLSLAVIAIIAWTTMMAVTINDIRVYVNPGHGCWMTRNLPLVNKALKDTTGFHESNTNLWKAFGMMEKLIEWGVPFDRSLNQSGSHHQIGAARSFKNNIVFSRVKNAPAEELSLRWRSLWEEPTICSSFAELTYSRAR